RRLLARRGVEGRSPRQSGVSKGGPQLQSDGGHRGKDLRGGGRTTGGGRHARSGLRAHAGHLRASRGRRAARKAHRATHREEMMGSDLYFCFSLQAVGEMAPREDTSWRRSTTWREKQK